jgi:hypothetical protein
MAIEKPLWTVIGGDGQYGVVLTCNCKETVTGQNHKFYRKKENTAILFKSFLICKMFLMAKIFP